MKPPRIVAVVGATATGKTAVGEALARQGAEIVCADSRQIFRELEIGTGKPPGPERAATPHHLFDALSLADGEADDARTSAGWYAGAAAAACAAIHAGGRLPVLIGGSGLYLRALMEGLAPDPGIDPEVHRRLIGDAASGGVPALHRRLAAADPETAGRIHPNDRQRVIRALEVFESSGHPSSWWRAQPNRGAFEAEWLVFELVADPGELRQRIERRTREMFAGGLIEEARGLLDRGFEPALARLRAVGYDEAVALVRGGTDRAAAEARTSLRTAQLAKRQRTWFRHQVDAIRIEAGSTAAEQVARAIREGPRPQVDMPEGRD